MSNIAIDTTSLWELTAKELMLMRADLLKTLEENNYLTPYLREVDVQMVSELRMIAKKKGYHTPGEHF